MRLANRTLRHVKHGLINPRTRPILQQYQSRCSFQILIRNGDACRIRRYSTTALPETRPTWTDDDTAKNLSPQLPPIPGLKVLLDRNTPSPEENEELGCEKWQWLSQDQKEIQYQSNVVAGRLKHGPGRLLVDKPENAGDIALWACLLTYRARTQGIEGVHMVWKGVCMRQALKDVEGPIARSFWTTILEAAVSSGDEQFLATAWVYAEWLNERYNRRWPDFYRIVVDYFLRNHQYQKAIKWHLHLGANLDPGFQCFAEMLLAHVTDQQLNSKNTLYHIYNLSPHHRLYDTLIPFLYNKGLLSLALRWREICILQDDLPVLQAPNRPFLRFLQGYFPEIELETQELEALSCIESHPPEVQVTREFMNRVHGETFGIHPKQYNDRLGARWLASRWVGLDTAVNVLAAFGVEVIGPLSLQAIAMREGNCDNMSRRLYQLENLHIQTGETNYSTIIRHFVEQKDDEMLSDFLHSDLHPDVFEDATAQNQILHASMASGDWRTCRLLLASKLPLLERTTRAVANSLLKTHLENEDRTSALKLLQDMEVLHIPLSAVLSKTIFEEVVVLDEKTELDHLNFCVLLCRRLASMGIPVPVSTWRLIILTLGAWKRLDDLEVLCLEIVSPPSLRPGFRPVHKYDLPTSVAKPVEEVQDLWGLYIPAETPAGLAQHPLSQLFDENMTRKLISWSFSSGLVLRSDHTPFLLSNQEAFANFHIARAVRLLRVLQDQGVHIHTGLIRQAIITRLALLFGPGYPARQIEQKARAANTLSLAEAKALFDKAWGKKLLPELDILKRWVVGEGLSQEKIWDEYRRQSEETEPRLSSVLY